MASVVYQFDRQLRESGKAKLFAGSHGCGDGEHRVTSSISAAWPR